MSHGPPGLARGHLAPSRQVELADSQVVPDHLPVSQQFGEHVMCRQCVEDVTRRKESYIESEGWSGHSAQHSAIMDHLDTPGVGQHLPQSPLEDGGADRVEVEHVDLAPGSDT